MESNQLPLDNVRNYLTIMLEKTDDQKNCLNKECRLAQDLLIYRFIKELDSHKENKDNRHCKNDVLGVVAETVKETPLEAVKAAKFNRSVSDNKIKTLIQHKHRLSEDKINRSGFNPSGTRKHVTTKITEIKKCVPTIIRKPATSAKNKTYSDEKCKQETSKIKSVDSRNGIRDSAFEFKDIDDILKKVTGKPNTCSVTETNGSVRSISNNKIMTPRFITFPEAVAINKLQHSSELIRTFELHHKLLSVVKNDSKRHSSKFISVMKTHNNHTMQCMGESFEDYKKWTKMKFRCSQRNYFLSQSSFIADIVNTFYCRSSEWKQVVSKLCYTEFLVLQLELIRILTEQLSDGVTFNSQNAPLLFLTCESLCTIFSFGDNKIM